MTTRMRDCESCRSSTASACARSAPTCSPCASTSTARPPQKTRVPPWIVSCSSPELKVMSVLVLHSRRPYALETAMESFIHLRKGKTPRRLHADLDGLKDDELGRGGFTGRTANMYRRNDPTAYRVERSPAPHRRAVQRVEAQRRHRRTRRPAADVLQRRLPGAAVAAQRADAVLRPLRRRRPADRSCTRARACWRRSSGRCATARATGCTSRRRARSGKYPTKRVHTG